jgi:hypothetical protein
MTKPNWHNSPRWARYLVATHGCWWWFECKPMRLWHGGFALPSVGGDFGTHHRHRFIRGRHEHEEQHYAEKRNGKVIP